MITMISTITTTVAAVPIIMPKGVDEDDDDDDDNDDDDDDDDDGLVWLEGTSTIRQSSESKESSKIGQSASRNKALLLLMAHLVPTSLYKLQYHQHL